MASYLPAAYQPTWNYSGVGQQMYPQMPQAMPQGQSMAAPVRGEIEWVDGEVGAKAYQIPQGSGKPVALWDTNEQIIYIRSMNPMGMPNPIQKAHYTLENAQGTSGSAEPARTDEYVRKEDMERLKQELLDAIGSISTGRHTGKAE